MKLAILIFSLFITGLITLTDSGANISGTWVMEADKVLYSPPVMHIEMGEGIWQGTIDIPEQEVYDKEIHSIRVKQDSIFITVYKDGPVINATLVNDNAIVGIMPVEGRVDTVRFNKIINQ
ncbi:MAG: hypothetical protein WBP16_12645 [Ferruginibacter sp.]